MDWTKAKTILIAALIITNLVLIFTYAYQDNLLKNSEAQVQNETIQLLKSKNIYINTEIPDKHSSMATLSVEYDKSNQDLIEEKLSEQKAVRGSQTKDKLIRMTTQFMKDCGLYTENVTFDSIKKNGGEYTITYKNYIDEVAIEDSHMIFTVKNGIIKDFERYWLNPISYGKTEKEVIPAVAALLKFMSENKEDEKINVEDISLVYWLDSSYFDTESPISDTALPAWKITYNHGKIKYVWALAQ